MARVATVAAGMVLVYALMPFEDGKWWIDVLIGVAAIAAIVPLTFRRVTSVRTNERPGLIAVEALVLMFTMLVFGFSSLYLALNQNGNQFFDMHTRIDAAYFTVTTLSTVGYGDIHPIGQAARMVVIGQILVDFTVVAISVRTLVSATRQRLTPAPTPAPTPNQ